MMLEVLPRIGAIRCLVAKVNQSEVMNVPAMNQLSRLSPESEKAPTAPSGQTSAADPQPYGILVVDDEACMRDILAIALRQQGFAVWPAGNGHEALDLYRRHGAAIDVVLMDVRMPGLDGPETLAALQQFDPDVRCCFMSGDLGTYSEVQLADLGAEAVIGKPFALATIGRRMWEIAQQDNWTMQERNSRT
jgi:CheY-like chemotaxis protein